jgi:hypothetical protein
LVRSNFSLDMLLAPSDPKSRRGRGRKGECGAHGQDRTADLPLTKGVLYH